ncbi:MAG: M48 family metallopeptidase [Cyanobacteria bacterium P01_F01_bin.53]
MNKYVPQEITDEVNVTPIHPLTNLGYLLVTVILVGGLIYAGLGLLASQLVTRIGPDTEEKIGAAMSSSFTAASDNEDSRVDYLNGILRSLQETTPTLAESLVQYPPLKVYILDTPVENAMVTAGSYVFVTEGLLDAAESENELAFVLAHELGHLYNRDPLRALGRSLVWVSLSSILGIGQVQLPGVVTDAANLSELNYGRNQETAADDFAVEAMMARYPHGNHSLDFFKRAQSNAFDFGAFNTVAEWNQTHPLSGDRITRIEGIFKANSWPLTGEATPLPSNLGCKNFAPCGE